MKKGFIAPAVLIILGLICLFVAGTLLFNTFLLKGEKQATPTPSVSPTPSSKTMSDETTNWKTYTNKQGYSLKYPPEWNVEENVNYISSTFPNYTFIFKEKVEFMPGIDIFVVPHTTPQKWLGESFNKSSVITRSISAAEGQATEVLNIPGALEQKWVFLDKDDKTVIFYVSEGRNEEISILNQILSTFKFLD